MALANDLVEFIANKGAKAVDEALTCTKNLKTRVLRLVGGSA